MPQDYYDEWLKEVFDALGRIPTITADEDAAQPPLSPPPVDIFSEKPIKRFHGGPSLSGKPKPLPIGGEAAAAVHRAISKR